MLKVRFTEKSGHSWVADWPIDAPLRSLDVYVRQGHAVSAEIVAVYP